MKIAVDYGNGIIWYFDNYPQEYKNEWVNHFWVMVEIPSQTLWI